MSDERNAEFLEGFALGETLGSQQWQTWAREQIVRAKPSIDCDCLNDEQLREILDEIME